MKYTYSPEAEKRIDEFESYHYSQPRYALELCRKILEDYKDDDGMQAFAHYYSAELLNQLAECAEVEEHCRLGIQAAKLSGNFRYHVACTTLLGTLALEQAKEPLAAEYLYESLALARRYHQNGLLFPIYMSIAGLYFNLNDAETALRYYKEGIKEFLEAYPGGETRYLNSYGVQMCGCCYCYVELKRVSELEEALTKLKELKFEETLPSYRELMRYMRACLASMKGEQEQAVSLLRQYLDNIPAMDSSVDVYQSLPQVYRMFKSYNLIQDQKRTLELMRRMADNPQLAETKAELTKLKIDYYTCIGDKEALFEAYREYYEHQNIYEGNYIAQRRLNLELRARMYEEMEQKQEELHALENLSETDELTGLYNRHALTQYVQELFKKSMNEQMAFGVILLDIDNYKGYNDTLGHIAGDDCLRKLSDIFREVSGGHFCARYGGDEFIFIFSDISREQLLGYGNLIRRHLQVLALPHPHTPSGLVTVSQGATLRVPLESEDFSVFLHEADTALYQCKDCGKDCIRIFKKE